MRKQVAIFCTVILMLVARESCAQVTFFVNDQAGFNAAASAFNFAGTEDWETSILTPNSLTTFDDPLAPGIANGPFPTGSLTAPGVTAQSNTLAGAATSTSPRGAFGLATASAGFLGTPSDQVSPNQNDSFDLLINPAGGFSGAVGLNPLYFDFSAASSTSNPGSVVVSVYDVNNLLVGTQAMNNVDFSASSFLGIVSAGGTNIRRINLWGSTNPANSTAGADNIAVFSSAVPEPGSLFLFGVAAMTLIGVGRRTRDLRAQGSAI
jgi:PEP-CTERM motif